MAALVHDFSRPVNMEEMAMAEQLRGHVCLEFKNPRTGIRERVEGENKFTNGIRNFLRDRGIYQLSPWANSNYFGQNRWYYLTGGVYLFNEAIPEGSIYKPNGTLMTANASYNTFNNGLVTELGSYNSIESSFKTNSTMWVYDWTTSQGNGKIASVCLGNRYGAYIGYGNSQSFRSMGASGYHQAYLSNNSSINRYASNPYTYYVVAYDNKDYWLVNSSSVDRNDTSITIREANSPVTKVSLFSEYIEKTVSLSGTRTQEYYCRPASLGRYVLYPSSSVSAGSSFSIIYIDAVNGTVEKTCNFTNNTGKALRINRSSSLKYFSAYTDAGSNITPRYAMYLLDCDNGSMSALGWTLYNGTFSVGGGIYDLSDDIYLTNIISSSYPVCFVDIQRKKIYPSNSWSNSGNTDYYNEGYRYGDGDDMIVYSYSAGGTLYTRAYKNPFYLASIYNLDQPVTKTTSTTMKLIYTITPA